MKKKICLIFTVLFLMGTLPAKAVDIHTLLSQIGFNIFAQKDAKTEITDVIELSNLSFLRYIQEIRAFLYNFNINLEVKYSRDEGKYYLVKTDSNDFIY